MDCISNFNGIGIDKNAERKKLEMKSLQDQANVKEVLPESLGGSNVICGTSLDNLAQKTLELEHMIKSSFPSQGIVCFEAEELLRHEKGAGDYVLNKLSETHGESIILITGLEKILLSESAQQLFLELYVAWHATGKILFITTTVPLEGGMGWNEKLLRRLEWSNIYELNN